MRSSVRRAFANFSETGKSHTMPGDKEKQTKTITSDKVNLQKEVHFNLISGFQVIEPFIH